MKRITAWLILVLALTLTGCALQLPGQAQPSPVPSATQLPPSPTTAPTVTITSTSIPTATLTPTPTPYAPFNAAVLVDGVNVRANPGYLFDVQLNVPKGTSFLILGKSPGGEWMYVQRPGGAKGWVFTQLFEANENLQYAPVIQPENVQLVHGQVLDAKGAPVSGLQFAITQGPAATPRRTDAMTDANGEFFAFMPPSAAGEWTVSYTAISCTSNVMDSSCKCKGETCGGVNPQARLITLPMTTVLEFTWK